MTFTYSLRNTTNIEIIGINSKISVCFKCMVSLDSFHKQTENEVIGITLSWSSLGALRPFGVANGKSLYLIKRLKEL